MKTYLFQVIGVVLSGWALGLVPATSRAGVADNGWVNVTYNFRTDILNDLTQQQLWQLLPPTWTPITPGDAAFDGLLGEIAAAAGAPISLSDYDQPFYYDGGVDFDGDTLMKLVGFVVDVVETGISTEVSRTIDTHGAVEGVDYLAGDSENPTSWIADTEVLVDVYEVTTETHFKIRTLHALVQPADLAPVAAVPLPGAVWAGGMLLGLLGAGQALRRRKAN